MQDKLAVASAIRCGRLVALVSLALACAACSGESAPGQSSTTGAQGSAGSQAPAVPAVEPAKVGVMLSYYTATGPSRGRKRYGFDGAFCTFFYMDAGHDVYPIIEPGTETKPQIMRYLRDFEATDHWVDGSDADALAELDVIVSARAANMRTQVIDAMTEAVRRGTGLLTVGRFGTDRPGKRDNMTDILAIKNRKYGFTRPQWSITWKVAQAHPLLPGFEVGQEIKGANFDGWSGETDGIVLVKAAGEQPWAKRYNPFYIHKLGKGTVVHYNFGSTRSVAPDAESPNREFHLRCVKWLIEQGKDR